MSNELRQALEQVARRFRHIRLWSALAICWLLWAFVGWGLALLLPRVGAESMPNAGLWAFVAAVTTSALICVAVVLRSARDPRWVARKIEAIHPELGTGLLAAVEQTETSPSGKLGFLQTAVIREALAHRRAGQLGRDRSDVDPPGHSGGPRDGPLRLDRRVPRPERPGPYARQGARTGAERRGPG